MSKRSLDIENKENEEPIPTKKMKNNETEKPESIIDDEEEEEKEPSPIADFIEHNNGQLHPTNKQYYLYQNTEPSMVSHTARFWSRKYLKVLHHVNPDFYDMYIHNDFVCYGELEVIENCLLDLAKGVFLKRQGQMSFSHYITTFRRLEALMIVLDCTDSFPGLDDGERFVEIVRVIGACYITILRDLLPKSMFKNEESTKDEKKILNKISHQLPNFKEVIRRILILGHMHLTMGDTFSAFTNILQTVYRNWVFNMENIRIDLNAKPNEKDEELWKALKHAVGIPRNAYKESFDFIKELSLYSINNPDIGGHSHDLRKWSKTKRNLYSFDNIDEDSGENFWFRL